MGSSTPAFDAWLDRVRTALEPDLEILRVLGKGSVARVLLAREAALKRLVAVKVLRDDLAADPIARARFEREAQAAARIRHPNVISVFRVGRAGDAPFIVMEYIRGRSLADRLAGGGPLSPEEVRDILASVADALASVHQKGLVHRDVRPANIIVEEDTGRVVLMDFGITALLESEHQESSRLTATGMQLGDPLHMSPEQFRGESVNAQSDVYLLGVLGCELLTGDTPPLPDQTVSRLANPNPLDELPNSADPGLERFIRRCLSPIPGHRPQAGEAAELLYSEPSTPQREGGALTMIPGLREFLKEIRDRKVGRVAVAYIICTFIFLQGVDLLIPALPRGDPEAWYRAIVALTLAGFPVALVLSWLFDITREGIRRAEEDASAATRPKGRRLILPVAGLVFSVATVVAIWFLIYRP